nr:t-complex polypeptide 1 homolog (peak 3 fraction) - rabbit (fragments) [Oryctolagus cuniculus]
MMTDKDGDVTVTNDGATIEKFEEMIQQIK